MATRKATVEYIGDAESRPDLTITEAFAIVIEEAESYRRLANEALGVVKRWGEYHLKQEANKDEDDPSLHLDHRMKF